MKVLYIAAECKPFSKAGGVGDVTSELVPVLKQKGIDIEIITPWYGSIKVEDFELEYGNNIERIGIIPSEFRNVPINFLKNSTFFEGKYSNVYINSPQIPFLDDAKRFSFFSESCIHLIDQKKPDVVHINDWVLGYLFGFMQQKNLKSKRVITVHNVGYQGNIGINSIANTNMEHLLRDEITGPLFMDPRKNWNSVNALKLGIELAHFTNTVSPNYCKEMQKPEDQDRYFEGGKGLHELCLRLANENKFMGILNGFEYSNRPTEENYLDTLKEKSDAKKQLGRNFQNPDNFLLGFVGRAVKQKFHLLYEKYNNKTVLEHLLEIPEINISIVATGLTKYQEFLKNLDYPNLDITVAFDKTKAKLVSKGCDVFLMPSLYEPCGITQLESMSNATPPLVRWTGGLVDTVIDFKQSNGTGFGFDGQTKTEVLENLIKCVVESKNLYNNKKDKFKSIESGSFQLETHAA